MGSARGGEGRGALVSSLCQFLRDSCRLGDHTSIMYPAGEGCLDRGRHVEIKEVIHPFHIGGVREAAAYRLWPWPEQAGEGTEDDQKALREWTCLHTVIAPAIRAFPQRIAATASFPEAEGGEGMGEG